MGADEVIVDLKRLTVPVGVLPVLETPKRGSLIPLCESPPEPLHEICVISSGVPESLGVVLRSRG